MKKVLYKLVDGKLTTTDLESQTTSQGSYYLNVSTMFDELTPMKTTEKQVVLMDSFLKLLKMKKYNAYSLLVNKLMNAVLTAKSIDDLTSKSKPDSFYNILMETYKGYIKSLGKKVNPIVFDNSNEYIATLSRLSIRYYVDDFYNNTEDVSKLKNATAFNALKVMKKRIASIPTRLSDDQKLTDYIQNLYQEGLNRYNVTDTKGNRKNKEDNSHKCGKCKWSKTTDCPKIMIGSDNVCLKDLSDLIIEGSQLISTSVDSEGNEKTETEYFIVNKCRGYNYFERKYREEQEKKGETSKYEVPPKSLSLKRTLNNNKIGE